MKIEKVKFLRSARQLSDCPESSRPEFSFIGRSNVGKSSLINWLTHKDGLARVSKTPGRTREINFFGIDESWTMVDLPGYGYAKVSKAQQSLFQEFVSDYLRHRPNLIGTFLLIDSRHSPQKIDLEFAEWLAHSEIPFALIFTKTDKSKPKVVEKNIELFCQALAQVCEGTPPVFRSSTVTREGRKEILALIAEGIQRSR